MDYPIVDGRVRTRALEYHITDHCNLRCDHCCSFSPILKKWLADPVAFREDLIAVRRVVRPEFLNRVDEIIMFQPLLKKEVLGIIKIQLANLKKLVAQNGITLEFSDYLVEYLAEQGFDIQYGARPLKRLIQKEMVNQLSRRILAGEIDKTLPVLVDVFDNTVVFRNDSTASSTQANQAAANTKTKKEKTV